MIIEQLKELANTSLKRNIHLLEFQYKEKKDYLIENLEYFIDSSFQEFSRNFNSLAIKCDLPIKIIQDSRNKNNFSILENADELYKKSQRDFTDALREDEYIPTMGKEEKEINFFISYSHKDKENVELLILELEKTPYSFIFWKDDNQLISGENFKGNIKKAIDECDFGLLMISENFESQFILKYELPYFLEMRSSDISILKSSIPLFINSKSNALKSLKYITDETTIFSHNDRGFIESKNRKEFVDALITEIMKKSDFENEQKRKVISELLGNTEMKEVNNDFIPTKGYTHGDFEQKKIHSNIDVVKEIKEWSNIIVEETEKKIFVLKTELIKVENKVISEKQRISELRDSRKRLNVNRSIRKSINLLKAKPLKFIELMINNTKIPLDEIDNLLDILEISCPINKKTYDMNLDKLKSINFKLYDEKVSLVKIEAIFNQSIYDIQKITKRELLEIEKLEQNILFRDRVRLEEMFYFLEKLLRILKENNNFIEMSNSLKNLENYEEEYKEEKAISFQELKKIDTRRNNSRVFALLGDSGMGKTWSCMKVVGELQKEKHTLKPIYLDLRKFASSEAIEKDFYWKEIIEIVITSSLHTLKKEMSINTIFEIIKQGEALVLFDGLDEVTVHLKDENKANAFIKELKEVILLNKNNKIVFSCRTHYFRTIQEQFSMLSGNSRETLQNKDFISLELLPFTWKQIEKYCKKQNIKFDSFKEILMSIHNLEEMSQRPYSLKLLSLQKETLEDQKNRGEVINSAHIYLNIIEESLNRDSGKHSLSKIHKPLIMRELSFYMWNHNLRELEYPKLDEWFDKWLYTHQYIAEGYKFESREKLKADLRGATFIVRPNTNVFRFFHTSLQEFFLAWYLFEGLDTNKTDCFNMKIPSIETLEFFVMLWKNSKYQDRLKENFESIRANYPIAFEIHLIMNRLNLDIDFDTPFHLEGKINEKY